jgi:hypothetical protein
VLFGSSALKCLNANFKKIEFVGLVAEYGSAIDEYRNTPLLCGKTQNQLIKNTEVNNAARLA